jgi:predicted transcriptional regulator
LKKKVAKTGLSKRIRESLKSRSKPITFIGLCEDLGIPPGHEREKARGIFADFEKRGEVIRTPKARFKYNHSWKRGDKAPLRAKIIKAMYVSCKEFTLSEIRERLGLQDRNYVQKVARSLISAGYIQQVGKRLCPHGAGSERYLNIIDRERFRIEMID